jgi:hypothetical protein
MLAFASVYHPQSNGVVERANGKIFTAIKKRLLDDKKGKWADQLPEVVWALNTIECRATGFTPFCMLHGSEAMMPQEIKHGSPRTNTSAIPDVDEPTSKDLIDGDRVFALQASTNTKLKPRPGTTMRSSQESSTQETSYSSGPPGQSHGVSWSRNGRVHSSSSRRHPPARTGYQRPPAKT